MNKKIQKNLSTIQRKILNYNHKKWKDNLETCASCIKLWILCWNLEIKHGLLCFKSQENGTGNGLSNIKDTSTESFRLQVLVLYESICIWKIDLSSLGNVRAEYKDKVLDVSDSIKMLEHYEIPNFNSQDLKTCVLKVQKNYLKMNEYLLLTLKCIL